MEFVFGVVDLDGFQRDPLNPRITASSAGTQCVIVDEFPIGNRVSVTELNPPPYSTVSCAPNPITMAPGINTVTCTNQALGKLEICKFVTDNFTGPTQQGQEDIRERQFTFRVNGLVVRVRMNRCSPPILLVPGRYTVTEDLTGNPEFELDTGHPSGGIAVTPSTAEVSRSILGRSVTIDLPWAGEAGDEVRVDFYNRVRRGQVKVCKHLSPGSTDALGGKTFNFTVYDNANVAGTITGLRPEECALLLRDGAPAQFPILNVNGTPRSISVREEGAATNSTTPGSFFVTAVSSQGARGPGAFDCSGSPPVCQPNQFNNTHIHIAIGANTNTLHFTNRAGPPGFLGG